MNTDTEAHRRVALARVKLHLSVSETTQKRLDSLAALWELPLGRVVDRLARENTPAPVQVGYFATPEETDALIASVPLK